MRGWTVGTEGEYFTHVYDKDYDDLVALLFTPEDGTLKVDDVVLNAAGIVKLRKLLQAVERHMKGQAE